MGVIEVVKAGMLCSVQDQGRDGYRYAGVPKSGAFDSLALSTGNRLLGNADNDAAIEMTLVGGEYRFSASTTVCLTGAVADDAMIISDDHQRSLNHQQPTAISVGSSIRVGRLSRGARGYLCVAGGVRNSLVLGSRSSLVSLPAAGLGRALQTGDQLPFDPEKTTRLNKAGIAGIWGPESTKASVSGRLRIVPGAHYEQFKESQQKMLGECVFMVSDQSNRAGVRLTGCCIQRETSDAVKSEGTIPGYVQVPPSGNPIVLGVDGPTTGGYPVIACVIEADLPVLAQCTMRQKIQFCWVSRSEALEALNDQYALIQSVQVHHPI